MRLEEEFIRKYDDADENDLKLLYQNFFFYSEIGIPFTEDFCEG